MKKTNIQFYIFIIIITFAIVYMSIWLVLALTLRATAPQNAYLEITVVDLFTDKKLENANICIIETNSYYKTDSFGKSPLISVPFIDEQQNGYPKKDWTDITLLVYREGYNDYICFYLELKKDSIRRLTVTLPPLSHGYIPFILSETPPTEWTMELIKMYKK